MADVCQIGQHSSKTVSTYPELKTFFFHVWLFFFRACSTRTQDHLLPLTHWWWLICMCTSQKKKMVVFEQGPSGHENMNFQIQWQVSKGVFCTKGTLNLINSIPWKESDVSLTYFLSHSLSMIIKQFISDTLSQISDVFKYLFKVLSQRTFYSVFCFLSILKPKKLTPTGAPSFMKTMLPGDQR